MVCVRAQRTVTIVATDERGEPELALNLPPHARIVKIDFDFAPGECRVLLDDGSNQVVMAESVRSLNGARIRQELIRLRVGPPPALAALASMNSLGPWIGPTLWLGRNLITDEQLSYAFAMQVHGIFAVLYMVADSFNFRKTLGPDSSSVTEKNLNALLRRLAAFAPHAARDAFVKAFMRSLPLPPPVGSLMEFLWYVARSDPLH